CADAGTTLTRLIQRRICAMRDDMDDSMRERRRASMIRLSYALRNSYREVVAALFYAADAFAPRQRRPRRLSDLQSDIERRGIAVRVWHRVEQQIAAAIAKNKIVGVARSASPSRGVRGECINAIGQRFVEVELRR